MSHSVAEWCDVEKLERATDNSQKGQELLLKGGKFISYGS